MPKEDQQIIVVQRDVLFANNYFEGFRPYSEVDYESRILENLKVMRRGDAEEDPSHKQPIGYVVIANPFEKKVFAYQRSTDDKKYGEKRLQGKWSWGFGGHIEPLDIEDGNPIRDSLMREVTCEELRGLGNITEPDVLGYINDDSNSIGQVHFGILYLLSTTFRDIEALDHEIARLELKTIMELEDICKKYDVETWSQIAMNPLKKLL